ncbi:MAG: alpha/beta fold hydrolase [Candidatus Paceibacterota bacterium]
MPQRVNLKTSDNINIAGDYYPTKEKNAPAIILLHMMPATKESWKDFAEKLNNTSFQCLAIDLRGHGESEGNRNYQASIKDVEAAADFFVSNGVLLENIFLCGASIGANLALQFQSEHLEIKASVLLSPGLDYQGMQTEPAAEKITENQAVFLAAGGESDEYSTETAKILFNMLKSKNKKLKVLENAGHGTDIFDSNPSLANEIILWIQSLN